MLFLSYLHLRLSSVSVVFDFNASLNDTAPESPILLPVDFMKKKGKVRIVDGCHVRCFFCLNITKKAQ